MSENKENSFNKAEYDNNFQKENYDRINFLVKKGKKKNWKDIYSSLDIKVWMIL